MVRIHSSVLIAWPHDASWCYGEGSQSQQALGDPDWRPFGPNFLRLWPALRPRTPPPAGSRSDSAGGDGAQNSRKIAGNNATRGVIRGLRHGSK